jgi:predicted nucleic acid-binding protein
MNYFFDSSAIIEVIEGNPGYSKFGACQVVTAPINFAEVHYYGLRENHEGEVAAAFAGGNAVFLSPNLADWKKAAEFRFAHKKKDFSIADCVGYTLAKKNGLVFLTRDKAFSGMPGTEVVI